jgi:beta-N-acetylhexosaminidase
VPPQGRRRLATIALALIALVSIIVGIVVGAGHDSDGSGPPPPEAGRGGPVNRVSFLAKLIPAAGGQRERPLPGPAVPRSIEDLARRLPLERKVAQLFVFGFRGTDLNSEIFRRLRRMDLGGILLDGSNYSDPTLLGQLAGEAVVVSQKAKHVPPWVLTRQEGGEFNSFPDLPPPTAPADLPSAKAAGAEAAESAKTLRGLGISGVLGPSVDVSPESGSPLGALSYSDDPEEVSAFADATVHAYRQAHLFSAAEHFPGLGTADRLAEEGPATVGLDLPALRQRDLVPFRAAIEAGVPGVLVGHGLYPFTDFTTPASLSRRVMTDLLRRELRFAGVAVTDDLASPAITTVASVPDAAVQAMRAGADMLVVSGPVGDQQAAYVAVLRAVRSGEIPRRRLGEAVLRGLNAKRDYGLIR